MAMTARRTTTAIQAVVFPETMRGCTTDTDCAGRRTVTLQWNPVLRSGSLPIQLQGGLDHCGHLRPIGRLDCTESQCNPLTGSCALQAVNEGLNCSDGDACTLVSSVRVGLAMEAVPSVINNPCTDDACVAGECTYTNNTTSCDDGSRTVADTCQNGLCVGTGVDCKDGDVCTSTVCDPISGCAYGSLTGPVCDDGNACTTGSL